MEGVFDEEYQAYMTSMIISQFLSIVNSYLSHKYITFKSKIKGMGMVSEFFKFTSAYIGTFIITILMLPLVTELFTLDPRLSAIIVMAIVAVGSYLLNAKYIFK
jgi:putative flippase GtrA